MHRTCARHFGTLSNAERQHLQARWAWQWPVENPPPGQILVPIGSTYGFDNGRHQALSQLCVVYVPFWRVNE